MTKDIITPVEELTDDFDAAFDEATADGESTLEASYVIEAPQEEPSKEEPSEEATPEEEAEQTDDDEDTSTEGEEGYSESASENPELKQLQALYEMERSRREQAERRYLTSEGRLRAANKQKDHKEAETPKKITSAALKEFEEDYPDLVDPINELIAARLAAAEEKVQHLIDERVSPIATQVVQSSEQSHFDQISTAHPDWRQILDSGELDKWQASLNPVARVGVDYVRQNGTTTEIIEMFNAYKQDTGKTSVTTKKAKLAKKEAPAEQNAPIDVDDLVGKLKAALAVPSSRGAAPVTKHRDIDPDDFDAAFEEATK